MSDPVNPYAAPKASVQDFGTGEIWRKGKLLVMQHGAQLPHRCVKCNAPAVEPVRARKIYWHQPWVFALLLVNLILYAIVALATRKQATIHPGLCPSHHSRRRRGIALGWTGAGLGILLAILGGVVSNGWLAVAGLLVFLGCLIAGVILAQFVAPTRIDKDFITLRGCGEAFLAGFPDFRG